MIRRTAILVLIGAFTGLADDLPKADTILDHYIEVTGGKAAYAKRKSEISTGTVEMAAAGLKGTLTRYSADPDKTYVVMDLEGVGKIEQGSIGGIAWEKSAMMGPRVKSGDEKAQALREGQFNGSLNWRKIFTKVETVGVATVNGEECYKVVLTPAEGKPETMYYQKSTGLVVKSETIAASPMGEVPVEVMVSDYKNFDGILLPTKMVQKVAGQQLVMTIQTIRFNQDIPPERFEPPTEIKNLLNKPAQ